MGPIVFETNDVICFLLVEGDLGDLEAIGLKNKITKTL